ncbi:MAG: phosphatase PAP2 family protein [Proteobacteria bacterium]|nr:phosphatase PAP2 family protein [Pseudomonadota bacterium]
MDSGNYHYKKRSPCSFVLLLSVFLLCLPCSLAHAESTDEIKIDWATDGGLTGSTGVLWITFELMKDYIAPDKCVWCQTNEMDETITDSLSWPTPSYAAKTADAVAFGAVPALAFGALALSSGLEDRIGNFGADALLLTESLTISSLVNQFVKFGVGRARPFTIRNDPNMYKDRADDNLSFYSGHTNMAFVLVVSAGTIAHIRNYDAEPYIWGFGIPVALLVAYARIAAQKHYFTDVLIGAVVGSAIGFAVPWLHRNTSKSSKKTSDPGAQDLSVGMGRNMISFSGHF